MRIAILGGGIAGLAAAYELEQQRKAGKPLDWQLFEASDRLGGIVQTTRHTTPQGEYILEGGPDAWVTEKAWARELAEELGLGGEIIHSRDDDKKTYIWLEDELIAMPDRMRMMVPEDLATLEGSPLFSREAKQAYAREIERAEDLKEAVPHHDESVASFVRRHFGDEVLEKIAAPLLSGVFGGDVAKLSVRAVMPAFVKMEAEHGSLITALQAKRRERGSKPPQPTFTTLRRGLGSLVDAIVEALPPERLHLNQPVTGMLFDGAHWTVRHPERSAAAHALNARSSEPFDHLILATPLMETRRLLAECSAAAVALLPTEASSAVLACFCWPAPASSFTLPPGFGFLVPPGKVKLLAATFTDQKFTDRAPKGARVIRVFFGGEAANELNKEPDAAIAERALSQLRLILPGLPVPNSLLTTVSRWPRSLPQYEAGHLDRMQQLNDRVREFGSLHLLGNSYRGVGLPDLIRDARAAARTIAAA